MCWPRPPAARKPGWCSKATSASPLVVRLPETPAQRDLAALQRLPRAARRTGRLHRRSAKWRRSRSRPGPNQISRENGKRRLVVTANVRGRDLGGFVTEAQRQIGAAGEAAAGLLARATAARSSSCSRPRSGWRIAGAGDAAVDLRCCCSMTFGSAKDALLVFTGVPLALTGGVIALWMRGIPLSITAGVGFITLSGVAVLTGVMMVSAFRQRLREGDGPG